MSAQRHEVHLLTGSYALDALPPDELADFEKHLRRCPVCAEEERGLREAAARMGIAAAVAPPPQMRERVLAAVPRTRQLPPLGGGQHASQAGRPRGLRRLPMGRASLTAGMVALAAAVAFLAVLQVSTTRQLHQSQASARAIAVVLAAPDAHARTAAVSGGGTLTVVASASEHEAVVTSANLPALSGGQVYQLWVINPAGTAFRSAGLLTAATATSTAPALASGVTAGGQLAVTVEPAGGTQQPTTKPVVLVQA